LAAAAAVAKIGFSIDAGKSAIVAIEVVEAAK